jgi:hypothetical protein
MQTSVLTKLRNYIHSAGEWYLRTPERALEEAYRAALRIRSIEDSHFGGGRISPDYGTYSKSAHAYFQSELREYLKKTRLRLSEFKLSSSIVRLANQKITEVQVEDGSPDVSTISVIDQPALLLKKLKLIDEVLMRYGENRYGSEPRSSALVTISEPASLQSKNSQADSSTSHNNGRARDEGSVSHRARASASSEDIDSIIDKTGVLPRSILRTVDRVRRELDPNAEAEMVENFRNSKARTIVSIRFILMLLIIPLLTQQVSKNFLIGPIVEHYREAGKIVVFINAEMEEEALVELQQYEERLKFEVLIGETPPLSPEAIEAQIKEEAVAVRNKYQSQSADAVKNIFSDLISAGVFASILFNSKREIAILKSFLDELVYGLSDSAKAFIIILLTDTFVGFHSPHGWEVLLEGVSRHLGLPANRDFIFLFIATFPVVLDTVFKYWIFRYLNRISPSAVATYRNMNE